MKTMKAMKCKVLNHVNRFQSNTRLGAVSVSAQMPALGGHPECGLPGANVARNERLQCGPHKCGLTRLRCSGDFCGPHSYGSAELRCARDFHRLYTDLCLAAVFTSRRRRRMGRGHRARGRGCCNRCFCIRSRNCRNRIRSDVCMRGTLSCGCCRTNVR